MTAPRSRWAAAAMFTGTRHQRPSGIFPCVRRHHSTVAGKQDLPFRYYPVRPSNQPESQRLMSLITSPLLTGSLDNRKVPLAALASSAVEANGTFPSCTVPVGLSN